MFVPAFSQQLDGHIGSIHVKIHIEVDAAAAEAAPDERSPLPTLASVQNTLTLLMVPLFKTLAVLEVGGPEALTAQTLQQAAAQAQPAVGPRLLNFERPPVENDACLLPPPGWMCTREKGHAGPCAALPVVTDPEGAPSA